MHPAGWGIGLRAPHVPAIVATRPGIAWLEVHAENYMGDGPAVRSLERLCADYPMSVHGVGLSLGSAEGLDAAHLERLARLVERLEPALVSEHLSWSVMGGTYLNHLLPLPYTEEALEVLCAHVTRAQERLGRRLLVENPSGYLRFRHSPISEPEFLSALARRTGCGLLCDVNNVYVTCANLGGDAAAWLDALDPSAVGEIHLAGHAVNDVDGGGDVASRVPAGGPPLLRLGGRPVRARAPAGGAVSLRVWRRLPRVRRRVSRLRASAVARRRGPAGMGDERGAACAGRPGARAGSLARARSAGAGAAHPASGPVGDAARVALAGG